MRKLTHSVPKSNQSRITKNKEKIKKPAKPVNNGIPKGSQPLSGKVCEVTPTSGRGCQLADRGGWTRLGWAEPFLKSSKTSEARFYGPSALLASA